MFLCYSSDERHARPCNPTRASGVFLQKASWGEYSNRLSFSIDFTAQIHRKRKCLAQQIPSITDSGFKQNAEICFERELTIVTSENQGYTSEQINKCLIMPPSLTNWEICLQDTEKENVNKWRDGLTSNLLHGPLFLFTLCWENKCKPPHLKPKSFFKEHQSIWSTKAKQTEKNGIMKWEWGEGRSTKNKTKLTKSW